MARREKPQLSRKNADRHLLYQWSVQNPEGEIDFIDKAFKKKHGRLPLILREDFCGTAYSACYWVKSHPRRRALGLDLDPATLEWGRDHNVAPLGEASERVDLRLADVRTVTRPRAEVVCAFNFSYQVFKELSELIAYFRKVRQSLAPGGIFVLDQYGGWESQQVKEESRVVDEAPNGSFEYIWEQAAYNPINNGTVCHIHFEFAGGRRWKKAFTYDWRLYTPAEVRDALLLAGFRDVDVYWDHEPDPEKDEIYRVTLETENGPAWITYVVGHA